MGTRRVYYDHEPVYKRILAEGGTGWRGSNLEHIGEFFDSEFYPEPGRALDLGCGGGEVAVLLAQRGWQVTAVEFSETALEMARGNAAQAGVSVDFRHADVTEPLPVDAGGYTLVLDNAVRHCLIEEDHRAAFMANAHRALRDGGLLFSANSCADGMPDYTRPAGPFDPETRIDIWRTRYWATLAELLQEFISAGFRVEHLELMQDPPRDFCSSVVIYGRRRASHDACRTRCAADAR